MFALEMSCAKVAPITYRNLFRNDAFESVDRNSYMVSGYSFVSLDELLQNLFFSSNFDEFMQIRAIFTWLSFVDVHKLGFKCDKNVELCKALNCLKFGGSYAEAFMKLVNHIGINAVCIKGWAKGHNFLKYNLGPQPANHSWNAVEIKCQWFLLDCYWSKSVSEDGKPEMDDFYFFADPRNMIFSHFPELPSWQLLPEPISFELFIEIPALKPDFFRFKLKLNDYSTPCVSENGLTILTLQHNANIFFKYKIFKHGCLNSDSHGFKHFIFEDLNNSSVTYYFRAPEKGTYVLKLFASTTNYSFANKFLIYKEVADFLIVTDAHSLVTPFPYSTDACWGVSNPYLTYNCPSVVSAFIFSSERKMIFSLKKMNEIFFIRACPSSLSKLSSMTYFEEDTKFNIFLDVKRLDAYGIEIYATDASQPKTFIFIGQLLICFNEFFGKSYSTSVENELQSISEDIFGYGCKGNLGLRKIFKLVAGGTLLNQNNYVMECILNRVKSGVTTHAHAFEWLCSLNGYGCVTISGLLKGLQSDFNYEKKHLWNAVFFNGSWHLVDCHLGRKLDIFDMYESAVEDYYFLTDPRKFIYTHFPFNLKWQLLEIPVSLKDFRNLVNVKPTYFKNNLSLVQPTRHCINVHGETVVVLKQNAERDLSFKCSLVLWNDKKLGLNNFLMHYFSNDLVIFQIRFPVQGTYHLVLYAKDSGHHYEEICEFVMKNEMAFGYLKSFIPSSSCWGYTNFAKNNGLKSSLETPFIETLDGSVKVSIYALKKFKLSIEFENCVGERVTCTNLMTKINNNTEILVNCPEVGEYCLKVFALNVEDCDSVLHKSFQIYVIFPNNNVSTDDNIVEAGVKIPFGFLGSQPSNILFDVVFLGDQSAVFESTENIVELTFYDRMNIDLFGTLVSVSPLYSLSSLVLKQKKECFTNFVALLPKEGYYLFQLYGSECSCDFLNIYNVLINCKCITNQAFEFPSQLRAWNGFLHCPLQKCLKSKDNAVNFRLEEPAASNVFLMTGHRSIPFTQTNVGVWDLNLTPSEFASGCQISICACDNHDGVNELLEYMIM